ncbi:hypothetical protein CASFOL_001440 [Castilleja foliolosa]|uniref:Uncharacterized protein n=1 Tax=Castilleja foliolosa TaxID=1961234 RepID=A0ABD3EJW2_9LAMI
MVEDGCTMMTTRAERRGGSIWVTPPSCDGGDCRGLCETLILMIGTKLHRIVVKLAVEIMDSSQWTESRTFNLRDELFWSGNPRILIRLIQFVSFQNAFEMATYISSMWEIKEPSCYTGDWLSPSSGVALSLSHYVIVTQMGSKFNKAKVSENVRKSLHGWRRKEINALSTLEECKEHIEETSYYKYRLKFEGYYGRTIERAVFMEGVVERTRKKSNNEDNQDDGQEEDEDHGQDQDPEDSDYSSEPTI